MLGSFDSYTIHMAECLLAHISQKNGEKNDEYNQNSHARSWTSTSTGARTVNIQDSSAKYTQHEMNIE